MRTPEINPPITFEWEGRQCVVVNNSMDDIVLCMEVGKISGIFSVRRSEIELSQQKK